MKDTLIVTRQYLEENPNKIFVFGDNTDRRGHGGAAALRDMPNTYGFITKIHPDTNRESYYDASDYIPVYVTEMHKLMRLIENNPTKTFLITALGAGLANAYGIWEDVIHPSLRQCLCGYPNVEFTWED